MRRRLFCPILAVAAAVTAMLGGADRADAAIRITISDGTATNTKVFYSNGDSAMFATTLGELDAVADFVFTNAPGTSALGFLSQRLIVSDIAPLSPLTNFTFTASVIDTVGGFGLGTFEVTGAQRTAVEASPLARFTAPAGTSLGVSSTVDGGPLAGSSTGTVQNNTTVTGIGGVTVSAGPTPLDGSQGSGFGSVDNNPALGYTITQEVVLNGATPGVQALEINAGSTVTNLTPEPASLAVWGLGAVGLVLGAGVRRFRKTNG